MGTVIGDNGIDRRIGLPDERPLRERLRSLVYESDTMQTRVWLTIFAFLQGISFLVTDQSTCRFVACQFLDDVMPYAYWAAVFLLYAVLKLWRIRDGKYRPTYAKIVNGFGAFLFGGFATALLVARWPFWILVVPNLVFAIASVWVCARTAIHPGRGVLGD